MRSRTSQCPQRREVEKNFLRTWNNEPKWSAAPSDSVITTTLRTSTKLTTTWSKWEKTPPTVGDQPLNAELCQTSAKAVAQMRSGDKSILGASCCYCCGSGSVGLHAGVRGLLSLLLRSAHARRRPGKRALSTRPTNESGRVRVSVCVCPGEERSFHCCCCCCWWG